MAKTELPEIYSEKPEVPQTPPDNGVKTSAFVVTKKPLRKKIFEFFFNGDIRDVKSYLVNDVIVPSIKETIYDMVTKGFDMLLFNSVGPSPSPNNQKTIVSYNKKYNSNERKSRHHSAESNRKTLSADDQLIFTELGPAKKVLSDLVDILDKYPYATKEDLNTILEQVTGERIPGKFTDNNWGWDNLSKASVDRVRGGYLLNLPAPMHID